MDKNKTKKLTTTGMLCALAYAAAAFGRVPLILFLKYDPKDVIIVIGGLIFGPLTSLIITLIVSVVQMFTISGVCCQSAVMLLWNYLIAPIYMGYTREAVAELLLPAFLPFNLIKGGLNAAATLLLYKPVITALRRLNLIEPARSPEKARRNIGVILAALLILITCILLILSFRDII